jgi:O-antigen/teichoic acid export membrane protein
MKYRSTVTTSKETETRKFAGNLIWVGMAQLLNSLVLGLVTMPWLTKSYTPEIYGIWITMNVTVVLISPCLALQLGESVIRFLSGERDKTVIKRSIGSMLLVIVIFSGIVLLIANLLAPYLARFLFANSGYTVFIRLLSIWIFVNALFNFFICDLYARNKIKLLSIRQVALSLITMAVVIFLASHHFTITWVILSVVILQALFTLAFFILFSIEIGIPYPNFNRLREFLSFSLPQIPGGLLLWIIRYSDRYLITIFLGLAWTGIYSSSSTLAGLTSLYFGPISFVLFPLLSRLWDENRVSEVKSYLEQSTRLFLTLAIPTAAGVAVLSQPLLRLLTTSEFLAGQWLVLLIALGSICLGVYQINLNIVLLIKRTRVIPVIIGIAAAVNILINVILLPRTGIIGAAIANLGAYLLLSIIVTVWAVKEVSFSFDYKFLVKIIGATAIMATSLYFFRAEKTWEIILAIFTGIAVYSVGLLVFRAFSEHDKQIIRRTLGMVSPGSTRGK